MNVIIHTLHNLLIFFLTHIHSFIHSFISCARQLNSLYHRQLKRTRVEEVMISIMQAYMIDENTVLDQDHLTQIYNSGKVKK